MSRADFFQLRKRDRPIIIWDTETTGLSPSKNHIVEIAMMELECTSPKSTPYTFSSLVHPPGESAPRAASRVHGITNDMMQDAPSFDKVWDGVLEYISYVSHQRGKPILVAHNLSFDLSFLKSELRRIGESLPDWDFACSLRDIAKIVWPGHSASLASLGQLLSIQNEEAHRALSDVETTSRIIGKADEHLRKVTMRMGAPEVAVGSQIRNMIEAAARRRRESILPKAENQRSTVTRAPMEAERNEPVDGSVTTRSMSRRQRESTRESRHEAGDIVQMQAPSALLTLNEGVSEGNGVREGEDVVHAIYITPMGQLWHTSRDCHCLDLALTIRKVSSVPPSLRRCMSCTSGPSGKR
ncbi:DNA polymerase III subunit epsilon [Gracilariopsis chorda]|uniref:DNA polymerase III subunit epsilon n=1 Tax=Gracilariopsis chorda TaxID=448386 RepID=A0A2V3J4A4_9FLOR|nr:DNA polymerase III subunit epsilon [Gracilariopsis chorda]|eukprot:PXF49209.1 DNA polymerase III subunit epsilon [Gracilariopsis chorda]